MKGYATEGSKKYTFGNIDTDEVMDAIIRKCAHTVEILDIGTANGMFVQHNFSRFGTKAKFHAISAHQYQTLKANTQIDYQIADANMIINHFDSNSLDLIISRKCFTHLVDPLGTLCQAYELLKDNGLLLIDDFSTIGIERILVSLFEKLVNAGHAIMVDYEFVYIDGELRLERINRLAIRKTGRSLLLPIEYVAVQGSGEIGDTRKAIYKSSYQLPELLPHDFPPTLLLIFKKYGQIIFDSNNSLYRFQDFKELNIYESAEQDCLKELNRNNLSNVDRKAMLEVISLIPQLRTECNAYNKRINDAFTKICLQS